MEKSFQTGTIGATLAEIAGMLGGELEGPPGFVVERLASAETADPAGLAFAEKQRYVNDAKASGVGALLIGPSLNPNGIPAIRVPDPRLAFFMLLTKSDRPYPLNSGIHPTAIVDPSATVSETAQIGPYAIVEAWATIEGGARVYGLAYVGEYCHVKRDAVVLPHATLLRNVELGERSVVFPGAVLGADGFGFVWDGTRRVKVPQVGKVVIGGDCEIGALAAVDRATAGTTRIGQGTKIDNLVQIAHNCTVGEHVVIAAKSALAGSSSVGDRSTLGGSTDLGDHVAVSEDVTLGGRAGVASDIDEPGIYLDFPAQPALVARRNMVHRTKLHELVARVRQLEEKLSRLEDANR